MDNKQNNSSRVSVATVSNTQTSNVPSKLGITIRTNHKENPSAGCGKNWDNLCGARK